MATTLPSTGIKWTIARVNYDPLQLLTQDKTDFGTITITFGDVAMVDGIPTLSRRFTTFWKRFIAAEMTFPITMEHADRFIEEVGVENSPFAVLPWSGPVTDHATFHKRVIGPWVAYAEFCIDRGLWNLSGDG